MRLHLRGPAGRLFRPAAPHERRVFELIEASAATAARSLAALELLMHHWPDRPELVGELADCRRESEAQVEAVLEHVYRSYVTALEREDLLALAEALARVALSAEAISGLLTAYRVTVPREHARRTTHVLAGAGSELQRGVRELQGVDCLSAAVTALADAQCRGEQLLRDGLADLVADDPVALELLAWRDVYEQLRRVIDECAAAARAMHAIELKER
jgi:uncharacterized protein